MIFANKVYFTAPIMLKHIRRIRPQKEFLIIILLQREPTFYSYLIHFSFEQSEQFFPFLVFNTRTLHTSNDRGRSTAQQIIIGISFFEYLHNNSNFTRRTGIRERINYGYRRLFIGMLDFVGCRKMEEKNSTAYRFRLRFSLKIV